jgi:Tfp pilus assembly protein PilO
VGNLSKREKILVSVGTIVLVFYLYFSFFLNPTYQKIKAQNNVIQEKKNQIANIGELKKSNIANSEKLKDLKTKFSKGFNELPTNEKNPEIARDLDSIAKKSNVTVNSLTFGIGSSTNVADDTNPSATPNDATNKKDESSNVNHKVNILPVTLIINGDFPAILNFTKNIEEDDRLAQIVSINISSKGDASIILQSNILINYYYTEGENGVNPTYDFKDDKAGKSNLFN